METFIALLRGINVSGQKIILMSELRDAMTSIGLAEVRTYIQSGNIVFNSGIQSEPELADRIATAIQDRFQFEVPVLVVRPAEIQRMLDCCPFDGPKKENSCFILLFENPDPEHAAELEAIQFEGEELLVKDRHVFLFSALGYGRSKFNNNFIERKLKVKATARNYRTMMKLLSLCNQKPSHD